MLDRAEDQEPPLPPDPVVEVYKKNVDRALLVERLRMTPEQRLRCLEAVVDAGEAPRTHGVRVVTDAESAVEAYKRDIDRGMLANNLRRSPEERLQELLRFQEFVHDMRRGLKRTP